MTVKALLIGIDGAGWDFVRPWMNSGRLPNLAAIVRDGVSAELNSVTPLNSASAWTTIVTGKNPASHGVFGFMKNDASGMRRAPVRSLDVGAATLWEIANADGHAAGVVNCPMTYPPYAIDGFLISGILIPYNALWAHPRDLQEKLKGFFAPYLVDVAWSNVNEKVAGDREKFIENLYIMTRKQQEAALKALSIKPVSVAAVFFTGTDRIMHRFWHHRDKTHPLHEPAVLENYGDLIKKYFSLVDEVLGSIVTKFPEAAVIVVSDHGFGPLHYKFNLRQWLIAEGILSGHEGKRAWESPDELAGIDFSKTTAFPASASESGIWINLKSRSERGTVKEKDRDALCRQIVGRLETFKADGGKRPIKKVLRREDALSGKFAEFAPDILIEPAENFIVSDGGDGLISLSGVETGTHRPVGIFAAKGPGIKSGQSLPALQSADVLPTFLAAAGLAIPEDMEGRVVDEVFENLPPIEKRAPVVIARKSDIEDADGEDEDKKRILKGLGYL